MKPIFPWLVLCALLPLAPFASADPLDDPVTPLGPECWAQQESLSRAAYFPLPLIGDVTGFAVWIVMEETCNLVQDGVEFGAPYYDRWLRPVDRPCVPVDVRTPNLNGIPESTQPPPLCFVLIVVCGEGTTWDDCDPTSYHLCEPAPRCLDSEPCEPWPGCRLDALPPLGLDSWPKSFGGSQNLGAFGEGTTVNVPGQDVPAVGFGGWEGVDESVHVPLVPGKDVNKPGWQGIEDQRVPAERTCVVPQACVNPVTVPGHEGWEPETLASIPGAGGYDQPVQVGPVDPIVVYSGGSLDPLSVPVGFVLSPGEVTYVVVVGSETLPGGSVLGLVDYCADATCPSNAEADVGGSPGFTVYAGEVVISESVPLP